VGIYLLVVLSSTLLTHPHYNIHTPQEDDVAYTDLYYNPAADEEPLWEMQQRQRREQAVLLEQQLDRQKKKAISEELRRGRSSSAPVCADVVDSARMGTRTRERNASSAAS
jgi:hypothetical protein